MMEVEHRDDLSVGPLVFQNQETTHLPPCDPKTQAEVVCEIERRNFPPLSGGAQHLISARYGPKRMQARSYDLRPRFSVRGSVALQWLGVLTQDEGHDVGVGVATMLTIF